MVNLIESLLSSNYVAPQLFTLFLVLVGKQMDRTSVSYSLHGSSSTKTFRAFNALGAIAFSFGDAMLPEIQVSITWYLLMDYLIEYN